MFNCIQVLHDGKDIIHDAAYDHHGRRIATCSSDQSVRVYDQDTSAQWQCTSSWKTHSGSVWRVAWAHPEFGQILATCSFDRTATIWEEVLDTRNVSEPTAADRAAGGHTFWAKRASLVDSRSNVTDVKFAPPHLGLQLATCSANGVVRIYDAPDIMNLHQVHLQHELNVGKQRCCSISWLPSKYHAPLIAVGSDEPTATTIPKVALFEFSQRVNKWARVEAALQLDTPVYDVQFAPNCGRSHHLLAVGSRQVHIYRLKPNNSRESMDDGSIEPSPFTRFDVEQAACFEAHGGQVWRVSWNVTGTVLSTAGADGTVKLWKASYKDKWSELSTVRPDESNCLKQQPPVDTGVLKFQG